MKAKRRMITIIAVLSIIGVGYLGYNMYQQETPDGKMNAFERSVELSLIRVLPEGDDPVMINAIKIRHVMKNINTYFRLRTAYDFLEENYSVVPPQYFYTIAYGRNGVLISDLEEEIENLEYQLLLSSRTWYITNGAVEAFPVMYKTLDSLGLEQNWRYRCLYTALQGFAGDRQIIMGQLPYQGSGMEIESFESGRIKRLLDHRRGH